MAIIILTGKIGAYRFDTQSLAIEGGTGKVYKGKIVSSFSPELRVGNFVAIKVLYRDLAANVLNIIRDENATKIRIEHPNLIKMYEFVEWKQRFHSVSEWLDGETLEDKLKHYSARNQILPLSEIKPIFDALVEAVACLHGLNPPIFHRDIKPGNLILCYNGNIKLIDFGIAKTRREVDQGQTVYGSMLGTPAYCPPEQIRGEHEKINASSDIYALGNIVFELFSGHQPFGGTQFEVSTKQVNDSIPEDDCREIVEPYRSFILKSTKKNQQDRFQNIQELRDHFEKKFENNVSKNEEKASGKDPITRSEIAHWLKLTAMFLGALLFFLMVFFEVYLILKEL